MSRKCLFLICTAMFLEFSCSRDNPLSSPEGSSDVTVNLIINRGDGVYRQGTSGLGKVKVITGVSVTVSASDMATIQEELMLSSDGKSASGSIEVPKGNARKFVVESVDANSVTQYSGSTTQDILKDVESVSIETQGHYPNPVSLTIGTLFVNSVELTWTQNSDVDFQEYEIYRSTFSTVDLNSTLITVISNRTTTSYVDETIDLNTVYYYRIIVWDTEGLGYWSTVKMSPVELGYDDNSFELGLIGTEQNEGLLVLFSAPSYPARLIATEMFLSGTQEFTIALWDWETGNTLVTQTAKGVNDSDYEWEIYDMSSLELTLSGDFYVGLAYAGAQQTDGYWWPAVGLDQTNSALRSYDLLSESFSLLDDVGYPGNLGIRAIVEVEGQLLKLKQNNVKTLQVPLKDISNRYPVSPNEKITRRHVNISTLTPKRGH